MLVRSQTLDTTTSRAALGLLAGAATGAALNAGWVIISSNPDRPLDVLGMAIGYFLISGIFWLIGAFTFGAAGWALLHAVKVRGPLAAILYGAGLLGGFFRLITGSSMVWALYAVAGGIAGLVVWAVSYRPRRLPVEVFGEARA